MIARSAESNPTCFSTTPLVDLDKTLVPAYLRLVSFFPLILDTMFNQLLLQSKYFNHNWGLTKFCITQFKGERVAVKKHEATNLRQMLSKAKEFDAVKDIVGEWTGEDEMREIIEAIEKNPPRLRRMYISTDSTAAVAKASVKPSSANGNSAGVSVLPSANLTREDEAYATPQNTQNPEPPSSWAPFLPKEFQSIEPLPSKAEPVTPTPVIPI